MSTFSHAAVHADSFFTKVSQDEPLLTSNGHILPRYVAVQLPDRQVPALLVAIDNGNDAFKGAVMHAGFPRLVTTRLMTAYAPAHTLRGGEGVTTYQVNGSEPFWIGEDALSTQGSEGLPVGLTPERLPDQRFQAFLAACLVELLREAAYPPGAYTLYTSFGVPNEEMTLQGIKADVKAALQQVLQVPFVVTRTDERGDIASWQLSLGELTPYPQSFGSFAAWYYTPDGKPIETTIVRHVTLDIGGGQFHDCEVDLHPQANGRVKLRMAANLLGDGTIAIARAAREAIRARHPGLHLSDAEAQHVLRTKTVIVGGHRVPVEQEIASVITARAQNLLTRMLPLLQDRRNFLLFTGGGSVLLEKDLRALVQPMRAPDGYLFVPAHLAPVLNVIGGYILAQASAQRTSQPARPAPAGLESGRA